MVTFLVVDAVFEGNVSPDESNQKVYSGKVIWCPS